MMMVIWSWWWWFNKDDDNDLMIMMTIIWWWCWWRFDDDDLLMMVIWWWVFDDDDDVTGTKQLEGGEEAAWSHLLTLCSSLAKPGPSNSLQLPSPDILVLHPKQQRSPGHSLSFPAWICFPKSFCNFSPYNFLGDHGGTWFDPGRTGLWGFLRGACWDFGDGWVVGTLRNPQRLLRNVCDAPGGGNQHMELWQTPGILLGLRTAGWCSCSLQAFGGSFQSQSSLAFPSGGCLPAPSIPNMWFWFENVQISKSLIFSHLRIFCFGLVLGKAEPCAQDNG